MGLLLIAIATGLLVTVLFFLIYGPCEHGLTVTSYGRPTCAPFNVVTPA